MAVLGIKVTYLVIYRYELTINNFFERGRGGGGNNNNILVKPAIIIF